MTFRYQKDNTKVKTKIYLEKHGQNDKAFCIKLSTVQAK